MDPGIRTVEYIAIFPVAAVAVLALIVLGAPYAQNALNAVIKFIKEHLKKILCALFICCVIGIVLYFAFK